MIEKGKKILKKKLAGLPEYAPDINLWPSIEARLSFEKLLSEKIRELPESMPSDYLWQKISATIKKPKIRILYRQYIYYAASVAAILAISAVLMVKLLVGPYQNVQITTEIVYTHTQITETVNNWPGPVNYINTLCRLNAEICNSPRFLERKKLLDELDKDEQELRRYEAEFGTSEALEKSKVRIEKMRTKTVKDILEMIGG